MKGNQDFKVSLKLMVENTINPILGYGLEPYKIGVGEMESLQDKQGKAIKDIFGLNRFVPNLCLLLDLGIIDIKYEIYKRKIMFYRTLLMNKRNVENKTDNKKSQN